MTTTDFDTVIRSNAGKSAIAGYAAIDGASGKGWVPAIRDLLATFEEEHAPKLLPMLYMEAAKVRVAGTKQVPVPAECTPQRLSNFRGFWKARGYAAWPTFLANMEPRNPGYETMVTLTNWFRSKDLGLTKTSPAAEAPSTDAIVAKLQAPQQAKADKAKAEPIDKARANPVAQIVAAKTAIGLLAELEGKGKGAPFLTAALKALDGYAPFLLALQETATAAASKAKAAAQIAKAGSK